MLKNSKMNRNRGVSGPQFIKKGILVIVSGPSGSGKTTIVERLVDVAGFRKSISATTRKKRNNEEEGRDYYFLGGGEFERRIKEGYFLEYARVFGEYYGTPLKPVMRAMEDGEVCVLEIDVQGAEQVLKKFPEALSIFIMPPENEKTLIKRLKKRSTETEEQIKKRLSIARQEMEAKDRYKYTVVNDNLERAVKEVKAIIESKGNV